MLVHRFSEMGRGNLSRDDSRRICGGRLPVRGPVAPISRVAECHLTGSARLSLYRRYVTRRRTSPEAVEQALIMNAARVDGEEQDDGTRRNDAVLISLAALNGLSLSAELGRAISSFNTRGYRTN